MQHEKTPRSGKREVLVDIKSLAAFDTSDLTLSLQDFQAGVLARRARITPSVARVVAALAFGRAA